MQKSIIRTPCKMEMMNYQVSGRLVTLSMQRPSQLAKRIGLAAMYRQKSTAHICICYENRCVNINGPPYARWNYESNRERVSFSSLSTKNTFFLMNLLVRSANTNGFILEAWQSAQIIYSLQKVVYYPLVNGLFGASQFNS